MPHIKKYISAAKISARIKSLGAKITKDYASKDLVVLGVLNGAVMFCSDLCRQISTAHVLDFVQVSSYQGVKSTGKITFRLLPTASLKGKDVLIVEDIIDTGLTIKTLKKWVKSQKAKSVKVCSLLVAKKNSKNVADTYDYLGFEIGDHFVVGYGLDHNGSYRHLPYIGILNT